MTWEVDFTQRARSDLVGLDEEVHEALIDALLVWTADGPPLEGARTMIDVTFHEAPILTGYLAAYVVDEDRRRFVILWLRRKPGA